jgi:prepilin-type N-terminal cleavage/methylation domain-containing protein
MKRQRKGFTLVELAIVIAILGILAVVAIPKYQGMVDEARSAAAKAQLGTVRSAIAISYAKNKGNFPGTTGGIPATGNLFDGTIFADGVIPSVDIKTSNISNVVTGTAPTADTGGWMYNAPTGKVIINSTAPDPANPSAAWSSY